MVLPAELTQQFRDIARDPERPAFWDSAALAILPEAALCRLSAERRFNDANVVAVTSSPCGEEQWTVELTGPEGVRIAFSIFACSDPKRIDVLGASLCAADDERITAAL